MKKHEYNPRTLVCRCGKTFEQHMDTKLMNDKVRRRWAEGDVDLVRDFALLK